MMTGKQKMALGLGIGAAAYALYLCKLYMERTGIQSLGAKAYRLKDLPAGSKPTNFNRQPRLVRPGTKARLDSMRVVGPIASEWFFTFEYEAENGKKGVEVVRLADPNFLYHGGGGAAFIGRMSNDPPHAYDVEDNFFNDMPKHLED